MTPAAAPASRLTWLALQHYPGAVPTLSNSPSIPAAVECPSCGREVGACYRTCLEAGEGALPDPDEGNDGSLSCPMAVRS